MAMTKYELSIETLKKVFNEIKENLPLNIVKYGEKSQTACIDCKTWDIELNPEFLYELMDKGLDEKTAYKGLLVHEMGHYKHHPFDLETSLMEIDALEKDNLPLGIKGLYDDFMCNARIILEGKDEALSKIYKVLKGEGIMNTLNGFYSEFSNKFGKKNVYSDKKLSKEDLEKIEKLQKINIQCRKELHTHNIKKFHEIFKNDEIPEESLEQLMKELKDLNGEEK